MRMKLLLLTGLSLLLFTHADAQSIRLGPQAGFYKAGDADNWSAMGGATCRLKFTPVLGAGNL